MQTIETIASSQPEIKERYHFPTLEIAMYEPGIPITNADIEATGVLKPNGKPLTAKGILLSTGIEYRHRAQPYETTHTMAERAVAGLTDNGDIGEASWIIVSTSFPTGKNHALGLTRDYMLHPQIALDVHAACSGFAYALTVLKDNEKALWGKPGLLVATENYSDKMEKPVDGKYQRRLDDILFTDGAGAIKFTYGEDLTVLSYRNEEFPPELSACIQMPVNKSLMREPFLPNPPLPIPWPEYDTFTQDGKSVLDIVGNRIPASIRQVVTDAGLTPDDIALIIPHQGSEPVVERLKENLPEYKSKIMEDFAGGNMSSASIPRAFMRALLERLVKPVDNVVFAGFGAGPSAATVLVRLGSQQAA